MRHSQENTSELKTLLSVRFPSQTVSCTALLNAPMNSVSVFHCRLDFCHELKLEILRKHSKKFENKTEGNMGGFKYFNKPLIGKQVSAQ